MARVPLQIDPHLLLDTLVEVQYSTSEPAEVVFGDFYRALTSDSAFTYLPSLSEIATPGPGDVQFQTEPCFLGLGIVLYIKQGQVVFNSINGNDSQDPQKHYPGWPRYREIIADVLQRLHNTGHIITYSQVGVRYINGLPWGPMNKQLALQLPPDLPGELVPDHTHFRVSLRHPDQFFVNLALGDSRQIPGQEGRRSVFDVDVRWQAPKPITDLQVLLARLDQAHGLEKEVFFGVLQEEYVKSLHPRY